MEKRFDVIAVGKLLMDFAVTGRSTQGNETSSDTEINRLARDAGNWQPNPTSLITDFPMR